jgi:hypothetical protein
MAELVKSRRLNAKVAGSNPTMRTFFPTFFSSLLIIHDVAKRLLSGLKVMKEFTGWNQLSFNPDKGAQCMYTLPFVDIQCINKPPLWLSIKWMDCK